GAGAGRHDDAHRGSRPALADTVDCHRLARRGGCGCRAAQAGREGGRRGASPARGMDRQLNAGAGAPHRHPIGRRVAWTGVLSVVVVVHLLGSRELAERMTEFNAAQAMPKRIEVAYVRTIEPEAPPAVSAPVAPPPKPAARAPRAPRPPRPAAGASAAEAAQGVVAEAPAPVPAPAPVAAASEAEPASTAAASASAPAGEAT